MRSLGVRSLLVTCRKCGADRVVNDRYHGDETVPSFGPAHPFNIAGGLASLVADFNSNAAPISCIAIGISRDARNLRAAVKLAN